MFKGVIFLEKENNFYKHIYVSDTGIKIFWNHFMHLKIVFVEKKTQCRDDLSIFIFLTQ